MRIMSHIYLFIARNFIDCLDRVDNLRYFIYIEELFKFEKSVLVNKKIHAIVFLWL